jgi:hypothetical protein
MSYLPIHWLASNTIKTRFGSPGSFSASRKLERELGSNTVKARLRNQYKGDAMPDARPKPYSKSYNSLSDHTIVVQNPNA